MSKMIAKCFECRAGEHEDISEKGEMFKIYLKGKFVKRGYLCEDHQDVYLTDGYQLRNK